MKKIILFKSGQIFKEDAHCSEIVFNYISDLVFAIWLILYVPILYKIIHISKTESRKNLNYGLEIIFRAMRIFPENLAIFEQNIIFISLFWTGFSYPHFHILISFEDFMKKVNKKISKFFRLYIFFA